jgi:hypothetical protein
MDQTLVFLMFLFLVVALSGATSAKKATPYADIPPKTRRTLRITGILILVSSLVGAALVAYRLFPQR